ncbi:MAG TPA: hypothetical protein VMU81_13345 [Acetobacteraceae bacterium]|jgi:hypothetical protein|nr:hypothetical protein [Acetobacteraceae bacterium]
MTETEDLSARLAALETVLRHLVTHLALHSDDPPRWVATRRVLALHEVQEHPLAFSNGAPHVPRAGLEQAIAGFFDPVEGVIGAYGASSQTKGEGTPGTALR